MERVQLKAQIMFYECIVPSDEIYKSFYYFINFKIIYLFTITLYLSHACEEYARIRHILSNVTFTYGQFKILIYVGMTFSQISNI